MKLVLLGFFPGYGGAEKTLIMLANELSNYGHDVTILSIETNNFKFKINPSVRKVHIPIKSRSVFKVFSRYIKLKKTLKKISPDVVVSFWLQPIILLTFLKMKNMKIIYSERGDPSDKEYGFLYKFLRKRAFKKTDGFVFQSMGAAQYFSDDKLNYTIINNAVDISHPILSRDERDKTIINVGRLHEQKNQILLIRAFSRIQDSYGDYKLKIFGDGPLKNILQKEISILNLSNKISINESTPEILNEISKSYIFVLSSKYEGMPNVILESMALGTPCISSDCRPGGPREIIKNGYNGLLFENENEEELMTRLELLLSNKELWNEISKNSVLIKNTHSKKEIYDKWNLFLMNILKSE